MLHSFALSTSVMMLTFSSQVSMASLNCNHAMMDDVEGVLVADVCLKNGVDSTMLKCINSQGILKMWMANDDCDEAHGNVFELSASALIGADVVCDAGPCHIALFEVYRDGSDSGDSSDSGSWNSTLDSDDSQESTAEPTMEPTTEPTTAAQNMRRLEEDDSAEHSHSDSSSAEYSCDYSSEHTDTAAFVVDACVPSPLDQSESIMITCTDMDSAVVSVFANDENHECSGTATTTSTASEYFGEVCGHMVACNVVAGEEHDAAPSTAVFTPLVFAIAVILYV